MTNKEIKEAGYKVVERCERGEGRTPKKVERDGYDYESWVGNKLQRKIEVKSTSKNCPSFRWLEEKEYFALRNNSNYFLYVVVGIGGRRPRVKKYSRADLLRKGFKAVRKYQVSFSKKEFDE